MSQSQHISTMFTVQGMRKFVCDRLTEAAQEILGAFEMRAQEYESELARQRRLLERVYSEHNSPCHTGPDVKEEEHDVSITDIQEPVASTSLHGVHRELQSSGTNEVQNAHRTKPERVHTSHLETEVVSDTLDPSGTQKTSNKQNKCSHGYRLPKSYVPKQNSTNKNNDKPWLTSNAHPPLEIIEIDDDSPASSDIEVIQGEPAATSQHIRETSDTEKEINNTNKSGNATSEESKKHKSGKKSSLPQPHSLELDNNHNDIALNMEFESTVDNMETETTTDMPSEILDVSTQCSEPVEDEENTTLPHDVTQNEEHICEDSTGDKTDGKGKSKVKKTGKEIYKNANKSNKPKNSVMDNDGKIMLQVNATQTIINKNATDSTSSTTESYQRETDTTSNISNEKRFEENIIGSSVNQRETPNPKPSHKNPFECDQCGKVSSNFKNYKAHIKSHTAEKKFKCETCDRMFREKGDLKKHRIIHTGEKPFKCPDCGKGFNRHFNMVLHRRVHTGERPHTCGSCDKTFSTQVSLRKHERIHTGEKPYSCERCQKEFADSSTFRNHQRVHTGERPYKCGWCMKKFATRTTLKRHSRVHTGERPYKCNVCHKGFMTNTDMKVHCRIHTGERPYKCEHCGQEFTYWTNYNRHTRTHKLKSTEPQVK